MTDRVDFMSPSGNEYQNSSSEEQQDERLDSWKEIAAYLDRDVRTVRRWEKDEGLPVHRHVHKSRPTVYAHQSEIDEWVKTRRPIQKEDEATRLYSWLAKNRRVLTYSAPLVLMVLVLLLVRGLSPELFEPRPGRALEFAERDWVLVLPFENRTGEEIFEKVLEHGLQREISNSRFVNVVPRDRIQDNLKLMKRDPETPIDLSLGREICQRDGEIRALLAGRVEKMDSTYLLSLVLMSPGPNRVLASASREAAGQAEVLPALRYLSNWARETLGEELATIQLSNQQLEKVTTPSFRALQLYSRAQAHSYRRQWPVAEQLLREAVELDPEFASAHRLLAEAMRGQDKIKESYAYDQRALELSATTNERERYDIIGTHHKARARHRKAAEAFQLLADLYPDHYWAHHHLTYMLPMQGQYKEAFHHARRAAELRPQDFYSINQAARLVVKSGGSLAEARQYVRKARELIPDDLPFGHLAHWILYQFPAYAAWMEGDLEGVLGEIDRLKAIPPNGYRSHRAFMHITLGQLEKAAELLAAHRSRRCSSMSIYLAWIREDDEALREFLRPCMGPLPMELPKPSKTLFGDSLLIRTGLLPPDQVRLREHREHEPSMLFLEAEIALAAGHTDTAIALLRKAFDLYPSNTGGGDSPLFWMAESLASILERQGRWSEAARVLERVSGLRYRVAAEVLGQGALWLRTQWQLSQLYHRLGLEEEAREIESELRQLLAYADPDHPIGSRLPLRPVQARKDTEKPVSEP